MRAGDEMPSLPDGGTAEEATDRVVQSSVHELGEREGPSLVDAPAEPLGQTHGSRSAGIRLPHGSRLTPKVAFRQAAGALA